MYESSKESDSSLDVSFGTELISPYFKVNLAVCAFILNSTTDCTKGYIRICWNNPTRHDGLYQGYIRIFWYNPTRYDGLYQGYIRIFWYKPS